MLKANPLLTQVGESLDAYLPLPPRQSILVAVSGGVDSIVLLHVLNQLAASRGWRLTVAHFNHQLRGRSSDADEQFVRNLAGKLDLPFAVGRKDVRKFAVARKLSLEMAGRELRHAFLAKTAERRKMKFVALAHHADDQVELFFLRLLRGTGGAGLAGMPWQAPSPANPKIMLVRPLLNQAKIALKNFAEQEGLAYREDASNVSLDFQRNRIRHELIPLLAKNYQPALSRVVLRLMEILRRESEAGGELGKPGRTPGKENAFESLPVAAQRRKIQAELKALRIPRDFELVERLRKKAGRAVSGPGGLAIMRRPSGGLTVLKPASVEFINGSKAVLLRGVKGRIAFENVLFHWQRLSQPRGTFSAPKGAAGVEIFDAEKLGVELVLRHWQPGDRFQPIGLTKSVKLQDLFTNQKIPREQRRHLVVGATKSGEVFWVEGLRMGARFKLDAASRYRLKWRWNRL